MPYAGTMSDPHSIAAQARVRSRVAGLFAAWLALACTLPPEVRAEAEGQDSPTYRRAVERAVEAYGAGQLSLAHDEFAKAHALYPNARTLRGLGSIELELKDYVAAARHLDEALRSQVLTLEGPLRAAAEGALREANQHVARVGVSIEPASAEVRLDGEPITAGEATIVAPGEHALEASAPSFAAHAQKITLSAGREEWVSVALERTRLSGDDPFDDGRPRARTLGPWLLVGAGGAALAGGIVMLALLPGKIGEMDDAERYDDWVAARNDARLLLGTGIALAGAGALATAGGLWWRHRRAHADVQVTLTPYGVLAHGRF